jgi:phage gp36-like protein
MEYSLPLDILQEFSESELAILTGDPTGVLIDWERYGYARQSADSTIDTYLWGVYDVPFTENPIYPLIKKLSVDLTICILYEIAYKDSAVPNAIVWRRIYAYKMLKDIRDGFITIVDTVHTENPPPTILSNKTDKNRIFNEQVMDSFFDEA